MRNFKAVIAYSGTHYYGWQKSGEGPSIEGALEQALQKILQHPVKLQAASRTDRGVHAEGQVVNFLSERSEIDPYRLQHSLRSLLPKDIPLISLVEEGSDFHPTVDATGKEYNYHVCMGAFQLPMHREYSWHYPMPLDIEKIRAGTHALIGTRDFSAFSTIGYSDPVRRVESINLLELPDERLRFVVKGEKFLYKMVRTLVGTLVHVGAGKMDLANLPSLFDTKRRALAGMTAPAHGLILKRVFY